MPEAIEKRRFTALRKLAAERYGKITGYEAQVLQRAASSDYSEITDSKERPEVRGEFLRWLITDKEAVGEIDPLGIRVWNATISDPLFFTNCKIPFPLELRFCTLKSGINLQWAEVASVDLSHCASDHEVLLDGVRVPGDISIDSIQSSYLVSIINAQIGGNLDCTGANLAATGQALNASGAKVSGDVFLKGVSSKGIISLTGAEIHGDLNCHGANLAATGYAPEASGAKFGNVYLRDKFSCLGTIYFNGAEIGGDLDCQGAEQFGRVSFDSIRVRSRLIFLDVANSQGAELSLFSATVG